VWAFQSKGEHKSAPTGQVTHRSEFWVAQVFADMGSTSVEAGTRHRYPSYFSLNLVLKILIRIRDI